MNILSNYSYYYWFIRMNLPEKPQPGLFRLSALPMFALWNTGVLFRLSATVKSTIWNVRWGKRKECTTRSLLSLMRSDSPYRQRSRDRRFHPGWKLPSLFSHCGGSYIHFLNVVPHASSPGTGNLTMKRNWPHLLGRPTCYIVRPPTTPPRPHSPSESRDYSNVKRR